MNQRLLTCEQYAISLKLLTVRGDPDGIQYHRRYISQCKASLFLIASYLYHSCLLENHW